MQYYVLAFVGVGVIIEYDRRSGSVSFSFLVHHKKWNMTTTEITEQVIAIALKIKLKIKINIIIPLHRA